MALLTGLWLFPLLWLNQPLVKPQENKTHLQPLSLFDTKPRKSVTIMWHLRDARTVILLDGMTQFLVN